MRVLLALLALAACTPGGGSPPPAGLTPLPAAPPAAAADPVQAAFGAPEVGLPLLAGSDGVTASEAAAAEPDQADALPLFDSWGWVSESTRSFGSGAASLQQTVLLLLRPAGAEDAFAYFSEAVASSALSAGVCPPAISGLDQCTLAAGGGRTVVVGRLGPEVFELDGRGIDVAGLAAIEVARLRS